MSDGHIFLTKSVRDLHWVFASSHLLTPSAGVPCCDDDWCQRVAASSQPWLRTLDNDPTPLEDWLVQQRNVRRLGFYYAALLEYWVRFCPILISYGHSADGTTAAVPAASADGSSKDILVQKQIHAGVEGAVKGQLKLVFKRRRAALDEYVHWEGHVKFFAWAGGAPPAPAVDDDEESKVEAGLAQYVGPFLGENLLHRVVELRRKISISKAPNVQAFLRSHFARDGVEAASSSIVTESVVRGWFFYPLGQPASTPTPAGVSESHLRGWWSRSLDEVLAAHPPQSLWALPGSGAGVRETATGALGGKLHWMAPAVARGVASENAGSTRLAVVGIHAIGVADCPLLTAEELRQTIHSTQSAAAAAARKPEWSWQGNPSTDFPAAMLVMQMLPLPPDEAGRHDEVVWVEKSRGFLMPPDWDPTPLCRAVPLGLRSGMRQKQRSGSTNSDNDYREADREINAVDSAMLAVRIGADGGFGPPSALAMETGGTGDGEDRESGEEAAALEGELSEEQMLANNVYGHLVSTHKTLCPPLKEQIRDVCMAFLGVSQRIISGGVDAPSAAKDVDAASAGDDGDSMATLEARFEAAVMALVSAGAVHGARGQGGKAIRRKDDKGTNSRFSLAKATIARTIAMESGDRMVGSALALLRRVLQRPEVPRLMSSLLVSAVATSGAIESDSPPAAACAQLLSDIVAKVMPVPTSVVVEMVQNFGARAARDATSGSAASCWPPIVSRDDAVRFVRGLVDTEADVASETLSHATQLTKHLRIAQDIDGELLIRRLADANLWPLAEQLAVSASEGGGEDLCGEAAEAKDSYVAVQKAAKAATVATVVDATQGADAVNRVARALGGYIKPGGGQPGDAYLLRLDQPPHEGGAGAAVQGNGASKGPAANGDGGRLLNLLLSIAQQRQNQRLIAKIEPLVRALGGDAESTSVHKERVAMVARLVSGDQVGMASCFVGADRGLQMHLVKLLCGHPSHWQEARPLAARFHLALSTLGPMRGDESRGDGDAAAVNGFGPATNGDLPCYALPAGTRIDVFDDPSQMDEAEAVFQEMRGSTAIGVDAEWVAGRPISLLQLSIRGRCVLLRMHRLAEIMRSRPPPSLVALLADKTVLKLGVGIGNDLRMLQEQYQLETAGLLELQALAAREGFRGAGLQRLTGEILGLHLDKRTQIRCGDWEAPILSEEQTQYAAMDAHVAVDLFDRLRLCHTTNGGAGRNGAADVLTEHAWCASFVDIVDSKRSSRKQQQPPPQARQQPPQEQEVDAIDAAEGGEDASDTEPLEATEVADALSSGDIAECLRSLMVDEERARLVPTGEVDASDVLDIKSLAVFAKGEPLIVVLPTAQKLDVFKVARLLQLALTSRRAMSKQVRLATPEECVNLFGYRPGTVPPLGHRDPHTPILLDKECAQSAKPLLAGGGDFGTQLLLEASVITAMASCTVADLSVQADEIDEVHDGGAAATATTPSSANGDTGLLLTGEVVDVNPWAGSGIPASTTTTPPAEDEPRALEPRFLVDAMMGRLLRWLRVLGVDSLLRDEGETVGQLLARARTEKRILLTRDRKLAERRDGGAVAVFVVSSDESRSQLAEIVSHFGLRLSATEFMMRCSVCNGRGYIKLTRDDVAGRNDCPAKVLEQIEDFYACKSCGKLYWEGPKSNSAFDHFSSVFDGFGASKGDDYIARDARIT